MQRFVSDSGPVFYQFDQWAHNPALVHGVFTRLGGVSTGVWSSLNVGSTVGDDLAAVRRNLDLMYGALAVESDQVSTVWLVHGADTVVVDAPLGGTNPAIKADGMVTARPGLPLVMRFADCLPVMFYDPVTGVVGMAHAGWRGTVQGAAVSVARTMIDRFGCRPPDIQVGIGPGIGPERYEVGAEVVQAFQATFGDAGVIHRQNGATYADLWAANRLALAQLDISQIEVAGICTATRTGEFFSHRAEHGKTGRFGTIIGLR